MFGIISVGYSEIYIDLNSLECPYQDLRVCDVEKTPLFSVEAHIQMVAENHRTKFESYSHPQIKQAYYLNSATFQSENIGVHQTQLL